MRATAQRRRSISPQALALADACRAPYERALTLIAHAELLVITDERRRARALLDEARTLCLPMDAARPRPDRAPRRTPRRARRSPARGAVRARGGGAAPGGRGLENAAIAERLFLSPSTVKAHVANIFAKIGVDNRAAATAFALRHGLA